MNNEVSTSKSPEGIMNKSIYMCLSGRKYCMGTNKAFYCRILPTLLLLLQVPVLKNPEVCNARSYT